MDDEFERLASRLIDENYVRQAREAQQQRQKQVRILLDQRKLPVKGWSEENVELFLRNLAQMDSNNFVENVGAGEREGRVFSSLVRRRHFGLAHGIGRSGDIAAVQPKAAGSSLLSKLTSALALDAIRLAGVRRTKACVCLPLCTGMTLALAMLTLRSTRPATARYVVWPRIDQKACLKSIFTAGFEPVVVEQRLVGDELCTNVEAVEREIERLGAENVLCVLSTTSCFAPRTPDRVDELARICATHNVAHIINNAYGLQSTKCTHLVNEAIRCGRVDAFVQSTDKNFMVPVGGAILASPHADFVERCSRTYAGRASASPLIDLLATLLCMGADGYRLLLATRRTLAAEFRTRVAATVEPYGQRLLAARNTVSFAVTLANVDKPTRLGSALFTRCTSGPRVVSCTAEKTIETLSFTGYGAHCDNYPTPYLTLSVAIGMTTSEIDIVLARLESVLAKERKDSAATTAKGEEGNH